MHKSRFSSVIGALLSAARITAGSFVITDRLTGQGYQRYRLAGGKNYVSRSRYTPGGSNRNCGDRGISPKSFARAQRAKA